jgi:hypothetical protein
LIRPVTLVVLAGAETTAWNPPGDEITEYAVTGLPPPETGAVQLTVADASPATAVTLVGAPGTLAAGLGVTVLEGADARLVPTALVAATVKV